MGHFSSQYIADCDAHTSDDDHYDRVDYGRTNSLESARQNARNGAELGSLKARYSDAHVAGRHAAFVAAKADIQARWKNALLAGDETTAEAVRIEGVKLCNSYYGVED